MTRSQPSAASKPGHDAAGDARPPGAALVTGGAQRLGREIALALAQAGWNVAVTYHGSETEALATAREILARGRQACALRHDLALAEPADALLAEAARQLGPVRCVVNNASLFEFDTAGSFSLDNFDAHMRTNVAGPIQLARALHAALAGGGDGAGGDGTDGDGTAGEGVVINLLDQKLWNPNPDFFSYTLSKAALEAATGLLARALAPRLRVVGLAPGITLPSRGQDAASFAAAHRATPLQRSSTPEDIARAVVYLSTARAVTGTTLLVDGGQHLLPTTRDILFLTS